jgi:hypothetical protein
LFPIGKVESEKISFKENQEKNIEILANPREVEKIENLEKPDYKNSINASIYKVNGYSDHENMWEFLGSLRQ